jgi:DNA polymerase-3 subunit epsilon
MWTEPRTKKTKLINRGIPIPKEATDVHGSRMKWSRINQSLTDHREGIKSTFEGCDIGGFNSDNFDVPLIIQEFQNVGIESRLDVDFIDVLKVERIINSNKLGEVFKRYTGETLEGAHDALYINKGDKKNICAPTN